MQAEVRAIAKRYDMAVMGPNSEGFANIANNLCPTFSPAMEAGGRPLVPAGRARPQLAVCAQSGGIGFAFFDHGRAKELSFRYVVTTGNEACLEALDFADFILDEGKTDALLLLLEDIKSAETFRRVAEKALRAGKPIIVNKIGQSDAGVRAAASHTAALAGAYAAYQAMFQCYGLIEGRDHRRDGRHRRRLRRLGTTAAARPPRRHLHGLGRRWRLDGGCVHGRGPGGAAARCGNARPHRRHLPSYGTSQNPVDATAQAVSKIGYAGLAELVLPSPSVDGIVLVMTARSSHGIERQRDALARLAETAQKPVLLWSYTQPAPRVGAGPERGGLSALHRHRQLRPHHAGHGRLPRATRAVPAADRGEEHACARQGLGARGAGGGRPGAVRVGGAAHPRRLRHRQRSRRHAGADGG